MSQSSFQTQHFPLEPSLKEQHDAKSVVSTEHTIPAIPAPNPWRSAEKAVSSARLDRMEAIAMPAAFAPSSPGEHRAKLDLYGNPYKHWPHMGYFCGVKSKYSVILTFCIVLEPIGLSTVEACHFPSPPPKDIDKWQKLFVRVSVQNLFGNPYKTFWPIGVKIQAPTTKETKQKHSIQSFP